MPLPYLHTAVLTARAAAAPVEASSAEDPLAWDPYRSSESVRVHAEGGLLDVVGFNTRITTARLTPSLASYVWLTVPLPLMLVGMVVGRLGVLNDIRTSRSLILRSLWVGVGAGVAGRVVGLNLLGLAGRDGWNPWIAMGGEVAWVLGAFFLAVAYSSALLLLLQKEPWRRIVLPLQVVGRTALTNYLLQTVICTALFYQFGLGLFGDVSPATAAALASGIFAFQLGASALWLRRYRFGPAEWLWRSVTYGSVLPNKKPA